MAILTSPAVTQKPAIPAPKPLVLVVGEAEIQKRIKLSETRGKSLQKDWHILACSVMAHIERHRATGVNANLANALVDSLPAGVRKNALRDWFCAHAAVSYNYETGKLMFDKNQSTRQIAGESRPFWEHKQEPVYHAFDLNKALSDLLAKAQRHIDKANPLDNIDLFKVDALKALMPVKPEATA